MTFKLALPGLLAAALLVPALGQAADDHDQDRKAPATFVKDSAITTKVKAKLATEHFGSLAKIHVDTDANGVVWLTGTAGSQAEIDKAVAIARGTERVRDVHNELSVKADK